MAVVALLEAGLRLRVRSGALEVVKGSDTLHTLQPHEVDEVQVHGSTEVSAAARRLLLREGIDLVFVNADGTWLGRLVGPGSRQGERRLAQYRLVAEPERRLGLARAVVASKITNQRALLLHRQRWLRDEELAEVLTTLRALASRAGAAPSLDVLRGLEGLAARRYFQGLGRALTNELFSFDGRNRRPPRDPINALLSFGYTLLVIKVEAAVRRAGLDPFLGCLHEATRGAPAMALDLAEELRPAVDGVVLTLVNRKQLTPEDFRTPLPEELGETAELAAEESDRACYLGEVARRALIRAWEKRLSSLEPHPLSGKQWPLRGLLEEQARQVARLAEGRAEVFAPLLLKR